MKYSKEFIKNTLSEFKDFKVKDNSNISKTPSDNFFVEFGNVNFLVNIPTTEELNANKKKLVSPLGVSMAFPLNNLWGDGIDLIDKYRISNQLVDENLSTCAIRYDEKLNSYFITAYYYPMLEQLPEFKEIPEQLQSKILRYVVLSLSTMCLEFIEKTKDMILLCKNEKSAFHKRTLGELDEE